MNDFETVRNYPQHYHALRALDRIEAEYKSWQGQAEDNGKGWDECRAEVERMRGRVKYLEGRVPADDVQELQAEVERLQRLVAAYEDIELVEEVERLRAELKREQERADVLHSQVLKFEKRIETGGWS